LVISGKQKKRK